VDCGKAGSSAVCHPGNQNPLFGRGSVLINIVNIIAYVAGAAAIIVIIIGAIRFATAGSDTSKGGRVDDDVANARRTIANALIGLVVIALGKFLITYVLGKI